MAVVLVEVVVVVTVLVLWVVDVDCFPAFPFATAAQ